MPEFSVKELWEKLRDTAERLGVDETKNHRCIVLWNHIIEEREFYKISLCVNRSYVYARVPRSDVEAFMNDDNTEAFHRIWATVKAKHIDEYGKHQTRK